MKEDFTTMRISKENRKMLDDIMYENRLPSLDAALSYMVNEICRQQAVISDLTTRAAVNAEERDQALGLLNMTVPELHQAVAQQKTIE
jgi:hypothetical protein